MAHPAHEPEQEAHTMNLREIGRVESPLTDRESAPKQGHEGGPEAWIAFDPALAGALDGLEPGQRVIVFTWFHQADRDVLKVHPRSDPANPLTGVFATRSPDRPNPIGMHPVTVLAIEGARVQVSDLEAIDGTPVIDLKPEL
jgi:tRNA-Thr(GGU) m(6)t(6)A37 methyltransferase TsaA